YLAAAVEKRPFVRAGFTQAQGERQVAAENDAAFAREPIRKPGRDRTDAGDRHHPERDAGDKHIEPAQAAAQFARGEAQRQRQVAGRKTLVERDRHQAFTASRRGASSMRPERSRTTRSQRAASAASWVTSTSVVPRCSCPANSRSMISDPVVS